MDNHYQIIQLTNTIQLAVPMIVNIFIQARMSSNRYPGKVLAPLHNVPLIKHIIDKAKSCINVNNIIVLTSTDISDDPLCVFLESISCIVFRGNLNNVFERFQNALLSYPCDYFVRLSADSPIINSKLIDTMIEKGILGGYDLISNVFTRKFPKGQSVEIVKSSVFQAIPNAALTEHEREHVIPYLYEKKAQYKCLFFELIHDLSHVNHCVDTIEDLRNISANDLQFTFNEEDLCTHTLHP